MTQKYSVTTRDSNIYKGLLREGALTVEGHTFPVANIKSLEVPGYDHNIQAYPDGRVEFKDGSRLYIKQWTTRAGALKSIGGALTGTVTDHYHIDLVGSFELFVEALNKSVQVNASEIRNVFRER